MRKTEAGVRARIESNRDQVPVELWSRAPVAPNGQPIPRIARTWVLVNTKDEDQEVQKRRDELDGRGFRFERTVIERSTT